MNVNFKLFSRIVDALADTNAWAFCEAPGIGNGFPKNCGPEQRTID